MKYKIPFINPAYRRFYSAHKKEIWVALNSCFERGDLTLRSDVWQLEKNIAKFVGTKYCASVNSGTDALFLSLLALGIGKGDSVITVSNTFIATIQAIVHTGAKPILIDVGYDEQMNVDQIEKAITKRTKAIVPVHYTGMMCGMKQILKIARKYNLYVVEDFCQALGAKQNGKMAGSFGILNAVSFNVAKLLGGFCDGGAVTTNNRGLYEKICLLRNHWNIHQLSVDRNDYPQPKEMRWAWKSRLSNVNAAFLNVKFKTIHRIIQRREQIALRYNAAFRELPPTLEAPIDYHYTQEERIWQEYHLKIWNWEREKFAEFLKNKGIETLTRDIIPNHKMKGLGLEHWDLPVTEQLAAQVIRLPLHEWLKDNEVAYIIKSVKEYFNDKK